MRVRILITVVCAVAVCASAASAYTTQTARFRGTISGQQASSWTLNQTTACGSQAGSGKQTFVYHQKRAFTLTFLRYLDHDGAPFVNVVHSVLGIPVTGTTSREGSVATTETNPDCRGTVLGPPETPPAPDCGTKPYSGFFDVKWWRPQDFPSVPGDPVPLDSTLVLDEQQPVIQFQHCPYWGPQVMQRLTNVSLPASKVFGTRKHLTLKAKVHRIDQDTRVATGVRADTTVSWTLRLTRLR